VLNAPPKAFLLDTFKNEWGKQHKSFDVHKNLPPDGGIEKRNTHESPQFLGEH